MTGGHRAGDRQMRVVVVNHMHPSVPHVSGMRAWNFSRELSARGHQVVLLCEWMPGAEPAPPAGAIRSTLGVHDWNLPLVLAVKPTPRAALDRLRAADTGMLLRKTLVAWSYVRHSGVFTDFSQSAVPFLAQLAEHFKPKVVWGILGKTDCWLMAQRLARLGGCGWVGDMKDAWGGGVPRGLRTLVARRFDDMAACTANSEFNANNLQQGFPTKPAIVYSGVDEEWIHASPVPVEGFRVMLVGATYDSRNLVPLVRGFEKWVQSVPVAERNRISFCYAGSNAASVESAAARLSAYARVDIRGHVPLSELEDLCRRAAVNAYLWSQGTFHHKLVELLCCQRPIVSFPGERSESVELARRVGGSLNVCRDERQLQDVLSRIWAGGLQPTGGPDLLQHLTWASQADQLETVLQGVAQSAAGWAG